GAGLEGVKRSPGAQKGLLQEIVGPRAVSRQPQSGPEETIQVLFGQRLKPFAVVSAYWDNLRCHDRCSHGRHPAQRPRGCLHSLLPRRKQNRPGSPPWPNPAPRLAWVQGKLACTVSHARPTGCLTLEMSASDISLRTRSTAWLTACHTGRRPHPAA